MRLFLVNMHYPHHRVASQPGCVKDSWVYKWVGRLPVVAKNPVQAAELFIDHIRTASTTLQKHAASCRVLVSEHPIDSKPGIKFCIGGDPALVYCVRKSGGRFFPVLKDDVVCN
jgi:hypothetical protein